MASEFRLVERELWVNQCTINLQSMYEELHPPGPKLKRIVRASLFVVDASYLAQSRLNIYLWDRDDKPGWVKVVSYPGSAPSIAGILGKEKDENRTPGKPCAIAIERHLLELAGHVIDAYFTE